MKALVEDNFAAGAIPKKTNAYGSRDPYSPSNIYRLLGSMQVISVYLDP